MNYLSELIFGKRQEPAEWENIPEPEIVEFYCIHYCPYRYENSCCLHPNPINGGDDATNNKIKGIQNNETDCRSTFPDFNEKIFDTEHYEQVIANLEKTYTQKAINNKHNIEIIKRLRPYTFNYNDKDYDFSWYEFVIKITKQV